MEKLIRDKIPEIMEKEGLKCKYHVADREEFISRLADKIVEEATEVKEAIKSKNEVEISKEIADLLDVVTTIQIELNLDFSYIESLSNIKLHDRGGFAKRIVGEFDEN